MILSYFNISHGDIITGKLLEKEPVTDIRIALCHVDIPQFNIGSCRKSSIKIRAVGNVLYYFLS